MVRENFSSGHASFVKNMDFKLDKRIILLTLAGSYAHGTNTEGSDIDLRGMAICPLSVRLSSYRSFNQFEGKLPISIWKYVEDEIKFLTKKPKDEALFSVEDCVIYDVSKSLKLMGDCNPNMFDLIFCDDSDVILQNELGEKVRENREMFLCTKVKHTYSGYAYSQLKKIKSHRKWLLCPPQKSPERKDFGLPEHSSLLLESDSNRINEEIENLVRNWGVDEFEMKPSELIVLQDHMRSFWASVLLCKEEAVELKLRDKASGALGLSAEVREALDRERKYRSALKQWKSYVKWKNERNPQRKEMEKKCGFDAKHASHLIRLMRMGCEILETGKVNVKRPDAEYLLSIRRGEVPYDEVVEEAKKLEEKMEILYEKNPMNLPKKIQSKKIDRLTQELILSDLLKD